MYSPRILKISYYFIQYFVYNFAVIVDREADRVKYDRIE